MPFTSALVVTEAIGDSAQWDLVEPLRYEGNRDTFVVPVGFRTDFASVPRVLWTMFPPYGRYTKAAVVHDYLYVSKLVSRADADGLFRRIMHELGVGRTRRWLMWSGVRLGGWLVW